MGGISASLRLLPAIGGGKEGSNGTATERGCGTRPSIYIFGGLHALPPEAMHQYMHYPHKDRGEGHKIVHYLSRPSCVNTLGDAFINRRCRERELSALFGTCTFIKCFYLIDSAAGNDYTASSELGWISLIPCGLLLFSVLVEE